MSKKIHDLLNIDQIKKDGKKMPLNVPLDGPEIERYVSWEAIPLEQIKELREFILKKGTNIIKNNISLNEREYNTRIGLAKSKQSGENGFGISRISRVIEELFSSDSEIYMEAIDPSIKDRRFALDFFTKMYSLEGIGKDSISDLGIYMMIENLKDYTLEISSNYLQANSAAVIDMKKKILVCPGGINLLMVPEEMLRSKIPLIGKKSTPFKERVMFFNFAFDVLETTPSWTRIANRIANKIGKLLLENSSLKNDVIINDLKGKKTEEFLDIIDLEKLFEYINFRRIQAS